MRLGPDATIYWHMGAGGRAPRPFHLRWLLPKVCGTNPARWWAVWAAGWVLAAVGMFGWQIAGGGTWQVAVAATGLLLGLPGFLGPPVTIPISVDVPATGIALCGVALIEGGWVWPGVTLVTLSGMIRETTPLVAAIWMWNPVVLVALLPVACVALLRRPGPDPRMPAFAFATQHPIQAAWKAHQGRWRDAWLMVAPWGVCLAALYDPSWTVVAALVVAHLQLAVATDTVRLVHHAAGPAMAAAAAQNIPMNWLLLAVAVHVVWWRAPERI